MRILTIGAVALALGGCGDKDAVDCVADPTNPACPQTGTGGGTDTTPTSDPGPSCDEVSAFSFSLDYAWDDTAAATTSFSIDGSSSPSVFVIEYGGNGWTGDPNLAVCIKIWDIDGMGKSQAATDAFAANGFVSNPAASAPIIDTCADGIATGEICPDFFQSSNGQAVEGISYDWRVMSDDVTAETESNIGLASYFDPGTYWAATLEGDLFAEVSDGYSFGFSVDPTFNVTAQSADIQQATMQTANGQVNGYYRVSNPFIWSFN